HHTFFFQAEDGIRDRNVTGVQTCALPISPCLVCVAINCSEKAVFPTDGLAATIISSPGRRPPVISSNACKCVHTRSSFSFGKHRSEERRVGKECKARSGACNGRNDTSESV